LGHHRPPAPPLAQLDERAAGKKHREPNVTGIDDEHRSKREVDGGGFWVCKSGRNLANRVSEKCPKCLTTRGKTHLKEERRAQNDDDV